MKQTDNNKEYKQLLQLIERYFDGETTTAEEHRLRQLLATTECEAPEVEDARAVMGVFAVARHQKATLDALKSSSATPVRHPVSGKKRFIPFAAISAAASVAVIIVAVLTILSPRQMSESNLVANNSTSAFDSITKMKMGATISGLQGGRMIAMATTASRVNRPETPDEIASLISSEMSLMAEAEDYIYESITEDFISLRDITDM